MKCAIKVENDINKICNDEELQNNIMQICNQGNGKNDRNSVDISKLFGKQI